MKATVKARLTLAIAVCAVLSCTSDPSLRPVPIEDIKICGELAERVARNFDRLEDEMYRPDSVFHSRLAQSWPGDAQGRIVRRGGINAIKLRVPVFAINPEVSINSKPVNAVLSGNFLTVSGFTDDDEICLNFELPVTGKIEDNGMVKYYKGPMLLGKEKGSDEMTPLYHLMDPKVNKENGYSKTILF